MRVKPRLLGVTYRVRSWLLRRGLHSANWKWLNFRLCIWFNIWNGYRLSCMHAHLINCRIFYIGIHCFKPDWFPPKVYILVANTKNKVVGVYLKQNSSKNKSNHTSQPTWNIRISYFFIDKRANLFANIMLSNIVEVFMHFWT